MTAARMWAEGQGYQWVCRKADVTGGRVGEGPAAFVRRGTMKAKGGDELRLDTDQVAGLIGASVEMVRDACNTGVFRCTRGAGRCGHYAIPLNDAVRFKDDRDGFARALRLARVRHEMVTAVKAGVIASDPKTGVFSAQFDGQLQFDATWLAACLNRIEAKVDALCKGLGVEMAE